MSAPTMTWRRLARRLGYDRNPLLRRSDLIEAWFLPVVIVVFVALAPLVAGAAGLWVRADIVTAQRAQVSWHRVAAVLLQAAPGPLMSDGGANTWAVWTPARWISDGRLRLGQVPAAAGTRAGRAVPVWLDRAGQVRLPPLTAAQARDRVLMAAAIALAALAVLLAGLVLAGQRVLDRRRLADWDAAWRSVGPRWSHQG